jgi:hypothetical protein
MLRPFRLVMLALLAAVVYGGFFWVPTAAAPDGAFDASRVAAFEAAAWQSARARQDFAVFANLVQMLREQHRYSWFRAMESGFYLARATTTYSSMQAQSRFDRLLPDLETVAGIEKTWTKASFDPAEVAKAQINWWAIRRRRDSTADRIGALIAEEYAVRYPRAGGRVTDAAHLRAQAIKLVDESSVDPDWRSITEVLTDSYRALGTAISQTATSAR